MFFAHCTAHTSSAIAYTMDSDSSKRECLAGIVVADAFVLGSSGVLRTREIAGRTATEQLADDIIPMFDRRPSSRSEAGALPGHQL